MSGDIQTLAAAAIALGEEIPGRHVQMRFQQPQLQQIAVDAQAAGEVYQTRANDTVGFFSRNRNASKVDVYSRATWSRNVTVNEDGISDR